MPKRGSLASTATLQFVMRAVASGEFCKEFEKAKFSENFQKYYGRHAIRGKHRIAVEAIMGCEECLSSLGHLHKHLHDVGFLAAGCRNTSAYERPSDFGYGIVLGVLLLLSSLAVGWWSQGGWSSWAAAGIGLVCAVWILDRARYDGV